MSAEPERRRLVPPGYEGPTTTWELWVGESVTLFPSWNESARHDLEGRLVLLLEVCACGGEACAGGGEGETCCYACWCAAAQARHDYLGWGPYSPPEPW